MTPTAPPLFAADRMLGRLTTWLRLIGCDVIAQPQWSGRQLLRAARSDGRTVLTRDRRVMRLSDAPPLLFIASDHFRVQLRQVIDMYAIDPYARLLTRCARCNSELRALAAAAAAPRVPPYVLTTQAHFVECPRCRRPYWSATHADRIRTELAQLGYSPGSDHA